MRLFDEKTFRAYGPFRNDLNELIAWEKSTNPEPYPKAKRAIPDTLRKY